MFHLVQNYFRDRRLYLNNHKVERTIEKCCRQGSGCGLCLGNIMYNALLNLPFSSHSKVIAYAGDLAGMTEGNTGAEV